MNNNGTSTSGYAIAVVNNSSYAGAVEVSIAKEAGINGIIAIVNDDAVAENKQGSVTSEASLDDNIEENFMWKALGTTPETYKLVEKPLEIIAAADGTITLSKDMEEAGYTFQRKVGNGTWETVTAMKVVSNVDELPDSGKSQTYKFQFAKAGEEAIAVGNTVGILHVADSQTNKTTIIGVPWFALGEKITVDSLVYLDNREAGDKITAYDSENDRYWTWVLEQGENGLAWKSAQSVTTESIAEAPAASTFELKRGQGLFLERTTPTTPIYLVGRVGEIGEDAAVATLAAGTDTNPTWTLVAAPATTDLDLNTASQFANPGSSDTIVVKTTGAGIQIPYTFENGQWGTLVSKQETISFGDTQVTTWVNERSTDNAKIPAGTGFWYLNRGTAKEVEWTTSASGDLEENGNGGYSQNIENDNDESDDDGR